MERKLSSAAVVLVCTSQSGAKRDRRSRTRINQQRVEPFSKKRGSTCCRGGRPESEKNPFGSGVGLLDRGTKTCVCETGLRVSENKIDGKP